MSNHKKKYNSMLHKVPKIEPKELYIADTNCNLRHIDRGEVSKGGISFDGLKKLEVAKSQEIIELKQAREQARIALTAILKDYGYNTPNVELKALIDDILKLTIIKPTYQYHLLSFNEDGYINGIDKIDNNDLVINLLSNIPSDLTKGYYKYENGQIIKDERKYNEEWSAL